MISLFKSRGNTRNKTQAMWYSVLIFALIIVLNISCEKIGGEQEELTKLLCLNNNDNECYCEIESIDFLLPFKFFHQKIINCYDRSKRKSIKVQVNEASLITIFFSSSQESQDTYEIYHTNNTIYEITVNCYGQDVSASITSFVYIQTILNENKSNKTKNVFRIEFNSCKFRDSYHANWTSEIVGLTLNNVNNINENFFDGSQVKIIEIKDCNLNGKLHYLNNISSLVELELNQNNLTTLDGLKQTTLRRITSYNNNLQDIPDNYFSNFPKLYYLHLSATHIQRIASQTFKNSSLASIHIECDNLTLVENETFSSPLLKTVVLISHHKNIKFLPTNFLGSAIENVTISCGLESISTDMFLNDKIRVINLRDNNLSEVSQSFLIQLNKLKILQTLNLSKNKIKQIPNCFFSWMDNRTFDNLDLSFNSLTNWGR